MPSDPKEAAQAPGGERGGGQEGSGVRTPPQRPQGTPALHQRYEEARLELLIEHPQNPRRGDMGALHASLDKTGFYGAIVVQTGTNRVLAGNHRLRALRERGEVTAPVIFVDVDDEAALNILLADNRTGDLAGYDNQALATLLDEVRQGSGLAGTGYDQAALDKLLAEIAAAGPQRNPAPETGQAEELRAKWGVEPDQVWDIGPHRLMCGDATCPEAVAELLAGEKPALMVTDPPYGVEYDPNWRAAAAESGALYFAPKRVGAVTADDRADWTPAWELAPCDVAYVWHGATQSVPSFESLLKAKFEVRAQIIWSKNHFPIGRGHYTWRHEPCWYAVRKGKPTHWIGDATSSTVWEISLDKNVEGGHSTQKPLECMARPIRNHTGDVYDPFGGSGTTMVAAQNLGRRCWMMEIDPGYCAVVLERMAQLGLEGKRSGDERAAD